MPEPSVERSVFHGMGLIITARINNQTYPSILATAGKAWMLVHSIESRNPVFAMGDSLISVFRQVIVPMTTNGFRTFLFIFGLTLQDLFNDNPEQTTDFVTKNCERMIESIRTKGEINSHTLRNLNEWADSLTAEASQELKKLLMDTIAKLQALPEILPPPPEQPKPTAPEVNSTAKALQRLGSHNTNKTKHP